MEEVQVDRARGPHLVAAVDTGIEVVMVVMVAMVEEELLRVILSEVYAQCSAAVGYVITVAIEIKSTNK